MVETAWEQPRKKFSNMFSYIQVSKKKKPLKHKSLHDWKELEQSRKRQLIFLARNGNGEINPTCRDNNKPQ